MSEREWGETAMVVNAANEEKVARYVGSWGHIPEPHWVFADGSTLLARQVSLVRPLVVIDPEDREAVERLGKALHLPAVDFLTDNLARALREFAAPKPPRPEEPTGRAATAEAECGCVGGRRLIFVRDEDAWTSDRPWQARCGSHSWDVLAAVRILSPGVEVDQ